MKKKDHITLSIGEHAMELMQYLSHQNLAGSIIYLIAIHNSGGSLSEIYDYLQQQSLPYRQQSLH